MIEMDQSSPVGGADVSEDPVACPTPEGNPSAKSAIAYAPIETDGSPFTSHLLSPSHASLPE